MHLQNIKLPYRARIENFRGSVVKCNILCVRRATTMTLSRKEKKIEVIRLSMMGTVGKDSVAEDREGHLPDDETIGEVDEADEETDVADQGRMLH